MKHWLPVAISVIMAVLLNSCVYIPTSNRIRHRNAPSPPLEQTGPVWVLVNPPIREDSAFTPQLTLVFYEYKRIEGWGGCNKYVAEIIEIGDGMLRFSPIGSTKVRCEIIDFEIEYFNTLELVYAYEFARGGLILHWSDGDESGQLFYEPHPDGF
jgi:heat shock protein HslJ